MSKTIVDHLEHLPDRLQEVGLKLKPSKCVFAKERVEYLGHTLSAEGVRPNDAKVEAVRNFPRPKSNKEVKSFLGLVNFYRRHLPNFAVVSRPLTVLIRVDKTSRTPVPLQWSSTCASALQKAK